MVHTIFLLFILYFKGVFSVNGDLFKNIVLDENVNDIAKLCKEKICVSKCCGKNEIMSSNELLYCMSTDHMNGTLQDTLHSYLESIPLYDNYYHDNYVNKKLRDVFFMVPRKFYDTIIYNNEKINFTQEAFIGSVLGFNEYLSESGNLYLEYPNSYLRWTAIDSNKFCIDIDSDTMTPKFVSVMDVNIVSGDDTFYAYALIISSVFLFLVLLVYMVLPELRNLAGLVLMAYVFSLLNAFILLACIKLGEFNTYGCVLMSALIYFFFLSSFCWMSVMSYDIWWTFRGYARARKIHGRGETFKFIMYCIYAWGVPIMVTIGFVEVDKMDLSHIPWFIKPQINVFSCFLQGGQQFVYMYIPMLFLIICNWFFFFMTVFNIWRLFRDSKMLNSVHRSQKNRLVVYLKLSVIMGTNWLLEIISFSIPQLSIWMVTDAYNLLIGFFIFLIFVWKPKIYRKLKARLIDGPVVQKRNDNSGSVELETSGTQQSSLRLCTNPEGLHS